VTIDRLLQHRNITVAADEDDSDMHAQNATKNVLGYMLSVFCKLPGDVGKVEAACLSCLLAS